MLSAVRILVMLAVLVWNGYFLSAHKVIPLYVDLLALTAVAGRLLWHKFGMPHFFSKHPPILAYFPLAYGMVLTEELYAALVNTIDEGYSTSLYLVRVEQLWVYNLIVFTGMIVALFLLHHLRLMRKKELIVIASLYGIYAEHAYSDLLTKPWIFIIYAPVVVFIYYLIFIPALSVLPALPLRPMRPLVRYLLALFIVVLLTLPCVRFAEHLRTLYPNSFPPCTTEACR